MAVVSECRQLDFEDAWKMFGEGRHTGAKDLFEKKLAPFLTQTSLAFWRGRLWYFQQGLYYQGGMVRIQLLGKLLFLHPELACRGGHSSCHELRAR